jgi:Rhodopirellula transposase DDE domain
MDRARGRRDLDAQPLPKGRVRRSGGGRRSVCENDPGLIPALERLVEPATLGDPMRPLIWVSKSMAKLAATLTRMGHPISADTVCTELVKLGFSRQSNRKADEGSKHPTETPSSNTSTRKSLRRRPDNNPPPSTPRRRN